ncbi:hypothetical protein [Halpernia sp.]|uniref:hypothetical protein n=1 Tax=Halpernia sp. TaxID=2782209 RepID=UPI003A8DB55E
MKISDLKIGQKVTIKGLLAEYQGIQKVKVCGFGKVEKQVFKGVGIEIYKYFSLQDGTKTLQQEGITLS